MRSILALDSSNSSLSIAIRTGSETLTKNEKLSFVANNGAGEQLLPIISELFIASPDSLIGLDQILISLGPGSYTGLRSGIAAAKGLQLGYAPGKVAITAISLFLYGILSHIGTGLAEGIEHQFVPYLPSRTDEVYFIFLAVTRKSEVYTVKVSSEIYYSDMLGMRTKGAELLLSSGSKYCDLAEAVKDGAPLLLAAFEKLQNGLLIIEDSKGLLLQHPDAESAPNPLYVKGVNAQTILERNNQ